jgi:type IV secretory pathway VirB4 component
MPDEKRELVKHFLAALGYRTQKALRGAPAEFGTFRPQEGVRSPAELVRLSPPRQLFVIGASGAGKTTAVKTMLKRAHRRLELP